MGEWFLPCDSEAEAACPDDELLAYCDTTYTRVPSHASWNRERLETGPGFPRRLD